MRDGSVSPKPMCRPMRSPRLAKGPMSPGERWQQVAQAFTVFARDMLWKDELALEYLRWRGLSDETIRSAGLGWNPHDLRRDPMGWGFADGRQIWLPRGWVIPWEVGGELWRVSIRRPQGKPKYIGPRGCRNALYGADELDTEKPAIMVEGEFDALTLNQVASDLVDPVATGSTTWARRPRWIARLALSPWFWSASMPKSTRATGPLSGGLKYCPTPFGGDPIGATPAKWQSAEWT